VPRALSELIRACWGKNPENRPRFDQIADNPMTLLFPDADETEYDDFRFELMEHDAQPLD
jgi:hypothetical protein